MPPDFILSIGGVGFFGFEVPEKMPFGVDQHLAIQKFIGGRRQIHTMGRDDPPIEWSGRFRGFGAVQRALALKAMLLAAQPVPLVWDQCAYTVLIRSLKLDERKFYEVPYTITVEVLSDDAFPDSGGINPSPQEQIQGDGLNSLALAASIGIASVSSAVEGVISAVQAAF